MAVTVRVTGETLIDGELIKAMQVGDTLTINLKIETENCETHESEEKQILND